jgi:hypothetical protein
LLLTPCGEACKHLPKPYTIIQNAYEKKRSSDSSKSDLFSNVWQILELISNNILMVNGMVYFYR